jgi:hypothetical protein
MLQCSNNRIKQMQTFDINPTRPDLLAIELEARQERARFVGAGIRAAMRALRDLSARFLRPTADGRPA